MLKIHEWSAPSGQQLEVFLREREGRLEVLDDEGARALPSGALEGVFRRYGAPFDDEATSRVVAVLELVGGQRVEHVRHLAGYDVIARDYLVFDAGDGKRACALATTISGALSHLARVAAR